MPGFSSVDDSPDPARLARYLDHAAMATSGIKAYAAAAHGLKDPKGPILDIGCGAGHDLALLGRAGLVPIGLDPSWVLLGEARTRVLAGGLVRGLGPALPFRAAAMAGVRIERVLQHVEDPDAVLGEALRVLAGDGLLTVFEPDWSRLTFSDPDGAVDSSWLTGVPHPDIGGRLWELVENAGARVLDRVEEFSVWRRLSDLDRVLGPGAIDRAVRDGRIDAAGARAWLERQQHNEAGGRLFGTIAKVLIVADKPSLNRPRPTSTFRPQSPPGRTASS